MSAVVHAPLPSSLDPSATRSSTTSTTYEHEIIHAPLPSRNNTSSDPPDSYSNVIDDDDQYSTESAIVRGEYGEDPPINSSESSRVSSECDLTTSEGDSATSEGGVENIPKQRKSKMKEKWKRKLLNRFKTKMTRTQDRKIGEWRRQ